MIRKDQKCTWELCEHRLMIGPEGESYCRALRTVAPLEIRNCEVCPLWNGLASKMGCVYYDFSEIAYERSPMDEKRYVDGLMKAGFTEEFPSFVSDEGESPFYGAFSLSEWSVADKECVEKAYQFAAKAHKGMKRKGTGIPYITHPMEVAYYALLLSQRSDVVAAAVLHDVVEDTKYTLKDICALFGEKIANMVASESENKREDMPKAESWHIRKAEFLEHLTEAPIETKMITLADKLANVKAMKRDWEAIGDELWNRFNVKDPKQHAWYHFSVLECTRELSYHALWNEYMEVCTQLFFGK